MIEDLTRHRQQALQAWAHPLSRPVRSLCDEVELLRRQLAALVADNDRLRADMLNLSLSNNTRSNSRNVPHEQRRDKRVNAELERIRSGKHTDPVYELLKCRYRCRLCLARC